MQKRDNKYTQILPVLRLGDNQISKVEFGEEFTYLGRRYNYEMNNDSAKNELVKRVFGLLRTTGQLKIRVQSKLKILSQYIHKLVLFDIKLYEFSLTWVEQSLDALCIRHIRDWMELPISACVREVMTIPKSHGGLGISSFKNFTEKMLLLKRCSMRNNKCSDIKQVRQESIAHHVKTEQLIANCKTSVKAAKSLKKNQLVLI